MRVIWIDNILGIIGQLREGAFAICAILGYGQNRLFIPKVVWVMPLKTLLIEFGLSLWRKRPMSRMGVWWWAVAVVRLRAPTEVHIGGGPVGEKPRICLTSHKAAQGGALGLRWKSVKLLVMSQENTRSDGYIVQPMWSHSSLLQVVVIFNLVLWHSIGLIETVLLLLMDP